MINGNLNSNDLHLLEQLCNTYGKQVVLDTINEWELSDKTKKRLRMAGSLGIMGASLTNTIVNKCDNRNIDFDTEDKQEISIDYKKGKRKMTIADSIPNYQMKVDAVNAYIHDRFRIKGFPEKADNLGITPEEFVEITFRGDFDLPLALAAAWVESHFGTEGAAAKTGSMFNIGAWDDGSIHATYATKAESLEHYIIIIKGNFLRGRTVDQLLKDGNFVNSIGKRYASNLDYEKMIRITRDKILRDYPILRY